MKKIAKNVLCAVSMVLMASVMNAVDFGAVVSDSTKFNFNGADSDAALEQKEMFIPSVKASLNEDGSVYFAAEAYFEHKLDATFDPETETDNSIIVDLNLFKAGGAIDAGSGKIVFSLGRFFMADSTGFVLCQPLDAASISYGLKKFEVSAFGGYTGLLNSKNVSILDSYGSVYEGSDDYYAFAMGYGAFGVAVTFPYLFANQTVGLESLGFIPLEGPSDTDADNSRFYGTMLVNGPLTSSLFYSLNSTLGFNDGDMSNLTSLRINYYSDYKNLSFGAGAVYASNDSGSLKPFVGFTKMTACESMEEPVYSSVLKASVSGSIKPMDNFLLSCGLDMVMCSPEDSFEYNGTQIGVSAVYQPFTDLSLELTGMTYLADDENNRKSSVAFTASLAF